MKIGVFFKHEKTGGGIYQYFLTLIDCIRNFNGEDRFFLFHCYNIESLSAYRRADIKTIRLQSEKNCPLKVVSRRGLDPCHEAIHHGKRVFFRTRSLTSELKIEAAKHKIDLMLYPAPERESFEVGVPYVMAIHDISHRIHPEFKEFSVDGIYEQREYIYDNGIKDAHFIMVDSEVGKEQLIDYYDTGPEKIKVLPFIPPPHLFEESKKDSVDEIRARYQLPDKFIFYPAQFWPHKNHENLIRALYFIKKSKGEEVTAVFVGSKQERWNGFRKMINLAKALNIESQIIYLGYIESEHMRALYEMATALVMPTFLGPTNLPILEAFTMGCPVITSDIKGVREQVGDAGILADPNSPEEIGMAIYQVWTDGALRRMLAKRGHERISKWTREGFCSRLKAIIDTCRERLKGV
ncbi:MAG: hypothetical protein DRH17_00840 [Deltaproteobacteria bacterium]|nr:MAG: hypothetical protein DRH17_00840 [Deltaproteobacteria bacterium]